MLASQYYLASLLLAHRQVNKDKTKWSASRGSEASHILDGERVQLRFKRGQPQAWFLPKEGPDKWFYIKPYTFAERGCKEYRRVYFHPDQLGELLECDKEFPFERGLVGQTADHEWKVLETNVNAPGLSFVMEEFGSPFASFTIRFELFGNRSSEVKMQNAKGTVRVIPIEPHSVKLTFHLQNFTSHVVNSFVPPEEDGSSTVYSEINAFIEVGFSDEYTPIVGHRSWRPGNQWRYVLSIAIGASEQQRMEDGDEYGNALANFTVSSPPTISQLVRAEADWGFEQVLMNAAFLELSDDNRTFSFAAQAPGATDLLYDPDFRVFFAGSEEDDEQESSDNDREWLVPLAVTLPTAVFLVLIVFLAVVIVRRYHNRQTPVESTTSQVNF
ncbi:hypothetical protein QOT17_002907 [Balamuthia mandrillaris]